MRLIGYAFTIYDGAARTAYVPLENLTVLMGPNDTGKSSVLRALLVGAKADMQQLLGWNGDDWESGPPGCIWFFAASRDEVATTIQWSDQEVELSESPYARDSVGRDVLGDVGASDLNIAVAPSRSTEEVLAAFLERLERDPTGQNVGAARSALEKTDELILGYETYLGGDYKPGVWDCSLCLPPSGDGEALASDGEEEYFRVPGSPQRLATIGAVRDPRVPAPLMVPLASLDDVRREVEATLHEFLVATVGSALLSRMPEEQQGSVWRTVNADDTAVQLRGEAVELCAAYSEAATALLPAFISQRYSIEVRCGGVRDWDESRRIRIGVVDRVRDVSFGVEGAAAGFQLWIQLALLDAARTVRRTGAMHRLSKTGGLGTASGQQDSPERLDFPSLLAVIRQGGSSPTLSSAATNLVSTAQIHNLADDSFFGLANGLVQPTIYLLDEPERNLHPGLQRSAAAWLQALVERPDTQAIIASHAHTFLNLHGRVRYVATVRGQHHTVLRTLAPDELAAVDAFATEMGFDRGELFSRIRVLLFVEGPADRRVVETLFGAELRAAGVQVLEMAGISRATAILEAALVRLTGAHVAVLLDKVTTQQAREMRASRELRNELAATSDEAMNLARLLDAAQREEREVHPYGFGGQDVLDVLDDESLRDLARAWPGHAVANQRYAQRVATDRRTRKRFFEQEFGLDSKERTIWLAAQSMARRGVKPAALTEIMADLERLAFS